MATARNKNIENITYKTTLLITLIEEKNEFFLCRKLKSMMIDENHSFQNMVFEDPKFLAVCLDEGNEFPPWFNRWKTGKMLIPVQKQQQGYPHQYNYSNLDIGEDQYFKFYLDKVGVTLQCDGEDKFTLLLVVNLKPKPEFKKQIKKYMKKILLTYHILCPVFV
jgi:hypothetical protein